MPISQRLFRRMPSTTPRAGVRSLLVGVVAFPIVLSGCGGDEITKDAFVDHALELSDVAKEGDTTRIRAVFECMWPEVSKDQELLESFMDTDKVEGELSTKLSKLTVPCVTGIATDPSGTTTTAPAATDPAETDPAATDPAVSTTTP